jgi:hypothetical protein
LDSPFVTSVVLDWIGLDWIEYLGTLCHVTHSRWLQIRLVLP